MRPRVPESKWQRVDRLKRQRLDRDTRKFPIDVVLPMFGLDPDTARNKCLDAGIPLQPITIRGGPLLVASGRLTCVDDRVNHVYNLRWEP